MSSTSPNSVFNIIGPIMVGPSSSHTAGAVRLGNVARSLLGCTPTQALIELHGSFALTGQGHGTDKALVAGLLGMTTDDESIRNSFNVARRENLDFRFNIVDFGEDAHPNSVRFTLEAGDKKIQMAGCSVGGGMIEVREINGYEVSFTAEYNTLIIIAEDQPGTINIVTGYLSQQGINVAFLKVSRDKRGGQAVMIIETDQPVSDHTINKIHHFDWVTWVQRIARMGS